MAIQPVPPLVLASEFPTNADRVAGVWNAKAVAWADSENAMVTRARETAAVTHNNATEAKTAADAAVPAAAQAVAARDEAVPAAAQAVAARNEAVPAAAQALDAAQRAEDAAAGIQDGPVTSVNGMTGVVHLGMADVAPGSVVAYGPDKASARAAIDAGLDYSRGQLTITASQTINKSIFGTATQIRVRAWGGGASGQAVVSSTVRINGGGGGEYVERVFRLSELPSSISVVIGAGGLGVVATTSTVVNGNAGGNTTFADLLTAYGSGRAGGVTGLNGGLGATSTPIGAQSSVHGGPGGGSNALPAGGTNQYGSVGGLGVAATTSGQTAGAGTGFGAGGGAIACSVAGTATSGAGAPGKVEIDWI